MGAAAVSTGSAYVSHTFALNDKERWEMRKKTDKQPILDGILGVSLIVHSHIGFDSIIVDYVHTRKFPLAGPIAAWALRAATGLAVWGVYEFNTNDVGTYLPPNLMG